MAKIDDLVNKRYIGTLQTLSNTNDHYILTSDIENATISQDHIDKLNRANQQTLHLAAFKERYIKIRTDNIALTHEHAIELVKMIEREAELITYKDTQ